MDIEQALKTFESKGSVVTNDFTIIDYFIDVIGDVIITAEGYDMLIRAPSVRIAKKPNLTHKYDSSYIFEKIFGKADILHELRKTDKNSQKGRIAYTKSEDELH